jgi:hypothetical protein
VPLESLWFAFIETAVAKAFGGYHLLDGGDPGGFKHRGLGVFKSVNMLFFGIPNSLPFLHPPPIGMAVMPGVGPKKLLTRINNYGHPEFI